MNESDFTLDQESLKHRLGDLPNDVKPHVRTGFHLLNRIGFEKRIELRDYIMSSMADSMVIDSKVAEEISLLNRHTVGDALTAATLAIASTLDLDVEQNDFIRFAPDEILDPADASAVVDILSGVNDRKEQMKHAMGNAALARSVLPSFENFSVQVDLRLKLADSGEVERSVPLAICSLSTDVGGEDIFFQADTDDIEKLGVYPLSIRS